MDRAIYDYILQKTGDPEMAAQMASAVAQKPGIMSRLQNNPTGQFAGPQPEARNQDPMNKSFVDFNMQHALPNFARSAAGLNPAFEIAGGAAQMATGDPLGGAERAIMGAFWPMRRKPKRTDADYINLRTGQPEPRPIDLDDRGRADWDAATAAAQARWKAERPNDQSSESGGLGLDVPPRTDGNPPQADPPVDPPSKSNEVSRSTPFNANERQKVRRAVYLMWRDNKVNADSNIKYDDIAWAVSDGVKKSAVEKYLKGALKNEMKSTGSIKKFANAIDKDLFKGIGIGILGGSAALSDGGEY
jgi:hypothetical protein